MKKQIIVTVVLSSLVAVGGWSWYKFWPIENPRGRQNYVANEEIDYSKYDFDSLKDRWQKGEFVGNGLEIKEKIGAVETRRTNLGYKVDFDSRMFKFESGGKQISGMINLPAFADAMAGKPVVIMVRGYADKEGYYPGYGTWRVADELAKAGYVTVSIDFLGYGESDGESPDMLEARFEKVENLLDLLASVKKLDFVDSFDISFWAHSNGGQIVLSVLEITGENYPTVLWAPMTNPFPESVLETIDEDSPVKIEIEKFSKKYDVRRYAIDAYYSWINSPILIIQGDSDIWCRLDWQQGVVDNLTNLGKEAKLVVMPKADHNMTGSWQEAVNISLNFLNH